MDLHHSRRHFLVGGAAISALPLQLSAVPASERSVDLLGPAPGYSPQMGTLISELAWIRERKLLRSIKGVNRKQLDFLLDEKANRIGALLYHLAATEKLYQLITFQNIPDDKLETHPEFKDWSVAMKLGDPARNTIKDHDLDFYQNLLQENRKKTSEELGKRDDAWLMQVEDKKWGWNNLCKWFHVCEHESHHTGQITLIKSRAPGAKSEES